MSDLTKVRCCRCAGCGKLMVDCDNIVFELYCVYQVVKIFTNLHAFVDNVAIKIVFIDINNHCVNYKMFNKARKGPNDYWMFPPPYCFPNWLKLAPSVEAISKN